MKKINILISSILILTSLIFAVSCAGNSSDVIEDMISQTASYTVEHYFQNAEKDGYTLDTSKTETKTGKILENTAAVALTLDGFTAKAFNQEPVKLDGTTVIKIYYDRIDEDGDSGDQHSGGTVKSTLSLSVSLPGKEDEKTIRVYSNLDCGCICAEASTICEEGYEYSWYLDSELVVDSEGDASPADIVLDTAYLYAGKHEIMLVVKETLTGKYYNDFSYFTVE